MTDIQGKISRFNKRWDITPDTQYSERFQKFKIRVENIFRRIDFDTQDGEIEKFCNIVGIPIAWERGTLGYYSHNIINQLEVSHDEKSLYYIIQVIFWLSIYHREKYLRELKNAIDISDVNLAFLIDSNDEVIFYPKGDDVLDSKLVDEVFKLLPDSSQTHLTEALGFYSNKKYTKCAGSMRRAIEELLKELLQNNKGLKANIVELQKVLKGRPSDPNWRNIIFQSFNYLDHYFNENEKHKDGDIDEVECEAIIYQTGLLMRYIYRLLKNN